MSCILLSSSLIYFVISIAICYLFNSQLSSDVTCSVYSAGFHSHVKVTWSFGMKIAYFRRYREVGGVHSFISLNVILDSLAYPTLCLFNPYQSNVELNLTVLSAVSDPLSSSNWHIILQCLMLVFPKLLLSSRRLEIFQKINLDQTVGSHKDNLDRKGLNMCYCSVYSGMGWLVQVNRQEASQMWVLLGIFILMLWVSSLQTNAEIIHSDKWCLPPSRSLYIFTHNLIPHVTLYIMHSWYSIAKQHTCQSVCVKFEVLLVVTVKVKCVLGYDFM